MSESDPVTRTSTESITCFYPFGTNHQFVNHNPASPCLSFVTDIDAISLVFVVPSDSVFNISLRKAGLNTKLVKTLEVI